MSCADLGGRPRRGAQGRPLGRRRRLGAAQSSAGDVDAARQHGDAHLADEA